MTQFVKPLRAGASVRPDKRTSLSTANFEITSLPPGIPHYIFENVVELINDNEPHDDILEMYVVQFVNLVLVIDEDTSHFVVFRLRSGDHSEAIISCVKAFLESQTQHLSVRNQ